MDRQAVAAALGGRMRALGMSRSAVARAAGIDRSIIARLLAADDWNPHPATIAKIERALRWPDGELDRIAAGAPATVNGEPEVDEVHRLLDQIRTMADEVEQRVSRLRRRSAPEDGPPSDPELPGSPPPARAP